MPTHKCWYSLHLCALLLEYHFICSHFFEHGFFFMLFMFYFWNVLADFTSTAARKDRRKYKQSISSWVENEGASVSSLVTPSLAFSQSSKEQMHEHIYKTGLQGAVTHKIYNVHILLTGRLLNKAFTYIGSGRPSPWPKTLLSRETAII